MSERRCPPSLSVGAREILEAVVAVCATPVLRDADVLEVARTFDLPVHDVESYIEHELAPLGWVTRVR